LAAGALGFATSTSPIHVGYSGKPVPSRLADDAEMLAMARALAGAGAMVTIRSVIAMRRHAHWADLVGRDAEPWQILSVLLALLEMAKLGELRSAQHRPFATVEISRDAISEAA
ncbi:MAG: hypothetical protein ACK5AK_12025, partial [Gemmatimonas sp.]